MPQPSDRKARIEEALTEAFTPETLRVTDDSASHAGHAGAAPGDDVALEDLDARATALDDLHVDLETVARSEVGHVVAESTAVDQVEALHDGSERDTGLSEQAPPSSILRDGRHSPLKTVGGDKAV